MSVLIISSLVVAVGFNAAYVTSPESNSQINGNYLLNVTVANPDQLANASNATFSFINYNTGVVAYSIVALPQNDLINDTFNVTIDTSVVLFDGIYNLSVNVSNATGVGQVVNDSIVNITVDNTAPTILSFNTPTDGDSLRLGSQTFNVTVQDATTSVSSVFFNLSNGSLSSLLFASQEAGTSDFTNSIDLNNYEEGNQTLQIIANDSLLNSNNTEMISFLIDRTAPTVNLESANNTNTTDNTPNIVFNVTDALDISTSCTAYVGGSSDVTNSSVSNASSTSITLSSVSDGNHDYYMNCSDSAGNIVVSEINTILIDTTAPNVSTFNSPINGANLSSGLQVFNVTVNDVTSSIDTVLINVTNGSSIIQLTTSLTGTDYNATLNVSQLNEGSQTITVIANDTLGLVNNSESISFTVDRTAPTVNILNSSISGSDTTPTITYNFTDSIFSSASCTLFLDGTNYGTNTTTLNATNTDITVNSALSAATYTAEINCTDGSNNIGNSSTISVTVTSSSSSSPSSSSSSSGGGGRLGASAGISTSSRTYHKEIWTSIELGEAVEVEIDNKNLAFTEISFETTETIWGPWIRVSQQEIENLPKKIGEIPTIAHSYLYVSTSTTLTNDKLTEVEIQFKVDLDWLEDNNIDENEIKMYHFPDEGDDWELLETRFTEKDDQYAYFVAESRGFSYFAIGIKNIAKAIGQVNLTIEEAIIAESSFGDSLNNNVNIESDNQIKEISGQKSFSKKMFWVIILLAIIIGIYMKTNKKKLKKGKNKKNKVEKKTTKKNVKNKKPKK